MSAEQLRYFARPVRGLLHRWQVWDRATNKAHAPYMYRSKHRCNKACDKLNGMSTREGMRYRRAKEGDYHG